MHRRFSAESIQDIPGFLNDTLKIRPIKQGTGPKGPYSVYIIDGQNILWHMEIMDL